MDPPFQKSEPIVKFQNIWIIHTCFGTIPENESIYLHETVSIIEKL